MTYRSKAQKRQPRAGRTGACGVQTMSNTPPTVTAPAQVSHADVGTEETSTVCPDVGADSSREMLETLAETAAAVPIKEPRYVAGENVFSIENPRRYLVQASNSEWKTLSDGDFRMRLRRDGFASSNEQAPILIQIQDDATVDYAAPLAGRKAGFFEANGKRILVTQSPKLVEPREGQWKTLEAFVRGLLAKGDSEHGKRQLDLLYAWLRGSVFDLRSESRTQAQALVIAGEAGCGKSLLQKIITECLGGRSAKAYRYLSGESRFNSDLARAEHLMLEDEAVGDLKSQRDKIKAGIKNFTVSTDVQSIHGKGRDAINLPVFSRLSISLNDQPDALRVLPSLDPDVEDKLILLRALKRKLPMPTTTTAEKERFWETLMAELPAFLHWLLNVFELPEELQDDRYPVKTWHHPKLREALEEISDECSLLALIDEVIWEDPARKQWEGTATDLQALLAKESRIRSRANKLLGWQNATGTLLGKAAILRPERISKKRSPNVRKWLIKRPLH
jgi:hypothetical protein